MNLLRRINAWLKDGYRGIDPQYHPIALELGCDLNYTRND